MTDLNKTRSVLQMEGWVRDDRGDTEGLLPPVERAFYKSPESGRTTEVHLDPDVYRDMGGPEIITVSIEPGDRLNGEQATEEDPVKGPRAQADRYFARARREAVTPEGES